MLVTGGGAIKPEADICPPQLDTEARWGSRDSCGPEDSFSSSKALSDPNRKQWPSKNPTTLQELEGWMEVCCSPAGGIRGPHHNLRSFVLLGVNRRLKLVTSGQRTSDGPISSGVYRLNTQTVTGCRVEKHTLNLFSSLSMELPNWHACICLLCFS